MEGLIHQTRIWQVLARKILVAGIGILTRGAIRSIAAIREAFRIARRISAQLALLLRTAVEIRVEAGQEEEVVMPLQCTPRLLIHPR